MINERWFDELAAKKADLEVQLERTRLLLESTVKLADQRYEEIGDLKKAINQLNKVLLEERIESERIAAELINENENLRRSRHFEAQERMNRYSGMRENY